VHVHKHIHPHTHWFWSVCLLYRECELRNTKSLCKYQTVILSHWSWGFHFPFSSLNLQKWPIRRVTLLSIQILLLLFSYRSGNKLTLRSHLSNGIPLSYLHSFASYSRAKYRKSNIVHIAVTLKNMQTTRISFSTRHGPVVSSPTSCSESPRILTDFLLDLPRPLQAHECRIMCFYQCQGDPEEGSSRFLRGFCRFVSEYAASYPIRR
jgi:hypothetical protein